MSEMYFSEEIAEELVKYTSYKDCIRDFVARNELLSMDIFLLIDWYNTYLFEDRKPCYTYVYDDDELNWFLFELGLEERFKTIRNHLSNLKMDYIIKTDEKPEIQMFTIVVW